MAKCVSGVYSYLQLSLRACRLTAKKIVLNKLIVGLWCVCRNEAGSGWICSEDRGQRPIPKILRADRANADRANADRANADRANADRANADRASADRANADRVNIEATPIEDGRGETATEAPKLSSRHTMGDDPAGWYRPSPLRPVQDSHKMHEDLAAAYFVLREDRRATLCTGDYLFREYPHSRERENREFPIVAGSGRAHSSG